MKKSQPPLSILVLWLTFCACRGQSFARREDNQEPFFIEEPDNVTIIAGKKVLLKCMVGNTQGRPVQWTFDNFGLGLDRGLRDWPHLRMVGVNPQSKSIILASYTACVLRSHSSILKMTPQFEIVSVIVVLFLFCSIKDHSGFFALFCH